MDEPDLKRLFFLRSYLGIPRYVRFEDTEFPVFEKVEDYLITRYGIRWLEIPGQKTKDLYPIHGDLLT